MKLFSEFPRVLSNYRPFIHCVMWLARVFYTYEGEKNATVFTFWEFVYIFAIFVCFDSRKSVKYFYFVNPSKTATARTTTSSHTHTNFLGMAYLLYEEMNDAKVKLACLFPCVTVLFCIFFPSLSKSQVYQCTFTQRRLCGNKFSLFACKVSLQIYRHSNAKCVNYYYV